MTEIEQNFIKSLYLDHNFSQGVQGDDSDIEENDKINQVSEEYIKEALVDLDLQEYSKKIKSELHETEQDLILSLSSNATQLIDLNHQIGSCDDVLAKMADMLSGYQNTLENISNEIEVLQEKSSTLNVKLHNRQDMQSKLSDTLDGLVIGPEIVTKIFQGEVNEFFLQDLADLNKKMSFVKANKSRNINALKEIGPQLERLRCKASEKCRDFLTKKMDAIKSTSTNIGVLQANVFLKYKDLYSFLTERYAEAAIEVRQNYITLTSNYYQTLFERYIKGLLKLQMTIADRLDLIGCEEGLRKNSLFSKSNIKDKTSVFTIGDRFQVLTDSDSGIIIPQVVEDRNMKLPFEAIFKSICRILMDNASSEYLFTSEFFVNNHSKKFNETVGGAYNEIFDGTVKLVRSLIRQFIDNSYDAIGVLLCIRLNSQNLRVMQKRRIPCLDNFLNSTNMLLWPKLQQIMNLHIESLRGAVPSRLLQQKDVRPHYITRRYSELSVSLLTLNEGHEDATLTSSFVRLRSEYENIMNRLSHEFPDSKLKTIFLINNYDLIVSLMAEHTSSCYSEEKEHFTEITNKYISTLVEAELAPYFGLLMNFVLRTEADPKAISIDPERYEKIATDFNTTWKPSLASINSTIMQSFPNFQTGSRILQTALTELVQFYRRFNALWEKRFEGSVKPKSSGVAVSDSVVEAFQDLKLKKKYKFIIFKISDDAKQIDVEKTVESGTYDDFIAALPTDGCRYCVYDFQYETAGEGTRNKILFYTWSPDTSKIKPKMLYASSKDALRKKLDGIYTEIQCTDLSEVSYETVLDKVTRMTS